jgi:GntP family gluconate:H+ symporter
MPIVVPIILIVVRSFVTLYGDPKAALSIFLTFIGTPYIALLIGTFISFLLPKKLTGEVTDTWVSTAIQKSAEIVLITGIAGCFGKILQATGVGPILADAMVKTGMPSVVLLPLFFRCLVDLGFLPSLQ